MTLRWSFEETTTSRLWSAMRDDAGAIEPDDLAVDINGEEFFRPASLRTSSLVRAVGEGR
jgi:hypothetical protein